MEMQTNLPATLNNAAVNILKETARSNPLLRFKKGKYLIGEDEIPVGREYVAFPLEWTRGWVKWESGQIADERVGKVGEGFVLLERDELGDLDKTKWEDPDSDPWQQQNMLPLEDAETGEFVVFVSGSFGGKIAIEKLCNRVARDLSAGRNLGLPTIKLGVTEFKTKAYGTVQRPEFIIIGWENEQKGGSVILPEPAAKVLDDAIPF
jgi:hypothetical protein